MNVLLIAGGSPVKWPDVNIEEFRYVIGIDRGSLYGLEQGWKLDLAVGDFDSLNEKEREQVRKSASEFRQVKAEKDDTDTQLALTIAVERFPQATFILIGATGGRLDHFLSNLWMPLESRFQPFIHQIEMRDNQNSVSYYSPGVHRVKKEKNMHYLAYCCLTPVQNLLLEKSKYTLMGTSFDRPISLASNEFLSDSAYFSFDSGIIAVIQSRDKDS